MRTFLCGDDDAIMALVVWNPMLTLLALTINTVFRLDREARCSFNDAPVILSVNDIQPSFTFLHQYLDIMVLTGPFLYMKHMRTFSFTTGDGTI